jgi:hypothetical protein
MLFKDGGNRFDEYAYRIATRQVADADAYLEEGSWVSLDANGKVINADGTTLAFLCMTSNRIGRDNLTTQAVWPKATYLVGPYELTVQNSDKGNTAFDATKTFSVLLPCKVAKDATTGQGILTPWVAGTDTDYSKIVCYALGAVDDGKLRIMAR